FCTFTSKLNSMNMKKNILLVAFSAGLLSVTACKKETTITKDTTDTDTTMVIEESIKPNDALQEQLDRAEANYEKAEADVKAEADAIKVRDEAKTGWENVKSGVNKAADDVKDGINKAADKVEEGAEKAGEKAKEVGKDIEDGYNKTLDKMKTDN